MPYYTPIDLKAAQFTLDWAHQQTMWVSLGGGTANVLAGELSRFLGCSYETAHFLLNKVGGDSWYEKLYHTSDVGEWSWEYGDLCAAEGVGKALYRRFEAI